jgi:hypothetical protein
MIKRWGVGSLGLIANWPKDQQEPMENIVVLASDYDALAAETTAYVDKLVAEKRALEAAMREIYEVYAGMEGVVPYTAPELYQYRVIKQMAEIARAHLASPATLPAPPR